MYTYSTKKHYYICTDTKKVECVNILPPKICVELNLEKNNQLVTANKVAALLNVKQKYIYQLVQQNKIPYYRPFGKVLYFKLHEVMKVVEASKVEAIKTDSKLEFEAANMKLGRGKRNG
jgi:excisionase family DNA binding protein